MKRFQSALARHGAHDLVGEVQSVGLVAGIQIVRDKAAKTLFDPAKAAAAYVVKRAQEHGLIVRNVFQDRVTICPPLIITEDQIDELSARLGKALDDAAAWAAKAA
jgi:4-aminobutyrate--pyruvate transaminase